MTRTQWHIAAEGAGLIRGNDDPEWVTVPDNLPRGSYWLRAMHGCPGLPRDRSGLPEFRDVELSGHAFSLDGRGLTHLLWVGRCRCGAVLMGCSAAPQPAGHRGRSGQTTSNASTDPNAKDDRHEA